MATTQARSQLAADLRLSVARLSRKLRVRAASGLTASQSSILATLHSAGPLRLGELAHREAIAASTASKAVERLLELGMLDQQADANDARAHILTLSAQGRRAAEQSDDAATALLADALAQLSPSEQRTLRQALPVLQSIIDNLAG